MDFTYIRHAHDMLSERRIDRSWVERTVLEPDWTKPDPVHSERQRAFRAVPERDGRVLRLVYELADTGVQVITVFLDRGRSRIRRGQNTILKPMRCYLRFAEVDVVQTEEVSPGVMLDFDASGRIVAIELLDASTHVAEGQQLKAQFAA